jgi:hypothetical protein
LPGLLGALREKISALHGGCKHVRSGRVTLQITVQRSALGYARPGIARVHQHMYAAHKLLNRLAQRYSRHDDTADLAVTLRSATVAGSKHKIACMLSTEVYTYSNIPRLFSSAALAPRAW